MKAVLRQMEIIHKDIFGKWKLDEKDGNNTSKYLKHIGCSFMVYNAAKYAGQDMAFEDVEEGKGLKIITSTKLFTTNDIFYFEIPREVTTKDGRKSKVTFRIEKNGDSWILHKHENWQAKGKEMNAYITMRVENSRLFVTMKCDDFEVNRSYIRS